MSARAISLACLAVLISLGMAAIGWASPAEAAAQASYILLLLALVIALVSSITKGVRRRCSVVVRPPKPRNSQVNSTTEQRAQ